MVILELLKVVIIVDIVRALATFIFRYLGKAFTQRVGDYIMNKEIDTHEDKH